MAKISTYPVVAPQPNDIIIGTDAGDSNNTKNFTAQSIADLAPLSNTLQQVLTAGNTATLNIITTGAVTASTVNVSSLLDLAGAVEANGSQGLAGQYLTSGGPGNPAVWSSLPSTQQGWNYFADGTYTVGSPLNVSTGLPVGLTNDGAVLTEIYGEEFWNPVTNLFKGSLNDAFSITIYFKASSTSASSTHLDVYLDGHSGSTIFDGLGEEVNFPKGNGVVHNFSVNFQFSFDSTVDSNGLGMLLNVGGPGTVSIYDIVFFIKRTEVGV